ncbi:GvpL/GvpF family gas vesicle protein [Streptomyces sp. NPDC058045]|uniref:GvpL/GvpF family gas vesicle protein n=1 Tax=Streptomyces sp. NPDC058045 TaxID=3346311 RepID=UPI0036E7F207
MTELRYVYAVSRPLSAPLQAELTGVGGGPVRVLPHGGLAAAVGPVPAAEFSGPALAEHREDPRWLAGTVRAHQRVVAALTTLTSPLPLRPLTVLRDDSAVRALLEYRALHFRRMLQRLDGRVEWGVELYVERAERDGTREEAEELGRRLHERLALLADEARHSPPRGPGSPRTAPPDLVGPAGMPVLDAAYLVRRARAGEFVAEVEAVKDAVPGLRTTLTGPWAAYSFTGMWPEPAGGTDIGDFG